MPGRLDPQQLLSGLNTQVSRWFPRTLRQEAMLPLVHVLRLSHHAKHRLVHLESQRAA